MAIASLGLNTSLMLVFGWMGSTCLDEWTMAVSGLAMSAAIFVAGGSDLSLDRLLQNRRGWLASPDRTAWALSGELPLTSLRRVGLALAVIGAVFTVGSYHILFGAVVSPLHPRVSYHDHHISLSNIQLSSDASTAMDAYVDAGPDTGAAYIIAAQLRGTGRHHRRAVGRRNACRTRPIGNRQRLPLCLGFPLQGGKIRLQRQGPAQPARADRQPRLAPRTYEFVLAAINGKMWTATVRLSG